MSLSVEKKKDKKLEASKRSSLPLDNWSQEEKKKKHSRAICDLIISNMTVIKAAYPLYTEAECSLLALIIQCSKLPKCNSTKPF